VADTNLRKGGVLNSLGGSDLGLRTMARRVYTIGVWLLLASIIVQFLLAGLGVFASSLFFYWHASVNSGVVFLLPLVLIAVGWLGRIPRRTLWLTAGVTGLVGLQSLLLFPYHMGAEGWLRAVSGLHVVNALLIFWVGLKLLDQTSALR
jgi:uncharacterized protein DUF6220